MTNLSLVSNKIIDMDAFVRSISVYLENYSFESEKHLDKVINCFIRLHVEIPAYEQAGLDYSETRVYIRDVIDNIDHLHNFLKYGITLSISVAVNNDFNFIGPAL